VIDKLSRPRNMPFPRVSQYRLPANGAPNFRLIEMSEWPARDGEKAIAAVKRS